MLNNKHFEEFSEAAQELFFKINPFGAVGKYIYHFFFLKFLDLKGKRNPKYFLDVRYKINDFLLVSEHFLPLMG